MRLTPVPHSGEDHLSVEKPLSHLHGSIPQELGDMLTSGSQPHNLTELVSRVARPVGVLKLPGGPAVHRG